MSKLAHSCDASMREIELNEKALGKIITTFVYPPIPLRQFDWVAYRDGTEESGRYGYGPTKDKAIAELLMLEDE